MEVAKLRFVVRYLAVEDGDSVVVPDASGDGDLLLHHAAVHQDVPLHGRRRGEFARIRKETNFSSLLFLFRVRTLQR